MWRLPELIGSAIGEELINPIDRKFSRRQPPRVHPPSELSQHLQHAPNGLRGVTQRQQTRPVAIDMSAKLTRLPPRPRHHIASVPEHPAPTPEASIKSRNYADHH